MQPAQKPRAQPPRSRCVGAVPGSVLALLCGEELAAVDDSGNWLSNNELFAIMLQHGVNKANKNNRLARGLTFPECLPGSSPRSVLDKWFAERVNEEYCEYRQKQLEELFQFNYKVGNDALHMLRKLLPGWMKSLYQILNFRKEMELLYANRMGWKCKFSDFAVDIQELLLEYTLSNMMRFVY